LGYNDRMAVHAISVEAGAKRVFAGAIEWPGWCRSARTEPDAISALVAYGPRFARALGRSRRGFTPPSDAADLEVVERLKGNATTDFGAPAIAPAADDRSLDAEETRRQIALLRASWAALDRVASSAAGVALRTGPRGGGRTVDAMVAHVASAEGAYLSKLGWRLAADDPDPREKICAAVTSRAAGRPPERTPRSGSLWSPRYFVRRTAWHALDHAWEIEDRIGPPPSP
jgi:hypothetical protein